MMHLKILLITLTILILLPVLSSSQTISITETGDTLYCLTGRQVKEARKLVFEYLACSSALTVREQELADLDSTYQVWIDDKDRKIKKLKLNLKIVVGIASITTIIAIFK